MFVHIIRAVFLLLSFVGHASADDAAPYQHDGPILLKNITVIDGLGTKPLLLRDVLVKDGRIAKIAVATMIGTVPDETKVIDGKGLTVLPGLIDAHTHIAGVGFKPGEFEGKDIPGMDRYLKATLYAGVTTILETGGDMEKSIRLRDEINAGERVGPTIHTVGAVINALTTTQEGVFQLTSAETQAEIKALLDAREQAGIEIIKLYTGITPWEARHIMTAAKKRGMRGIADFWCTNLSRTVFEVALLDAYAHGGCRKMTGTEARWMAANDKFAMITFTAFDTMGGHRAFADYPARGFLKNPLIVDVLGKQTVQDYYDTFFALREAFEEGEQSLYNSQLFGDVSQLVADNQHNVRLMHEAGVIIGMGTDAAFPPGGWPGEAMHWELEHHVKAGIPPLDAIRMATHNNAVFLRRDHETGMIADLLIVRGDPSTSISDTRNIVHVIKGGKLLDRDALKHR